MTKFPLQRIGSIMYKKLDALPQLSDANKMVTNQPVLKPNHEKYSNATLFLLFNEKSTAELTFISAGVS